MIDDAPGYLDFLSKIEMNTGLLLSCSPVLLSNQRNVYLVKDENMKKLISR